MQDNLLVDPEDRHFGERNRLSAMRFDRGKEEVLSLQQLYIKKQRGAISCCSGFWRRSLRYPFLLNRRFSSLFIPVFANLLSLS